MFKPTEIVKSVLQLLALAFLAWLMYVVRGLVVYVIIAALLSLLAKPFTNWLSSRKIGRFTFPRSLATLFTMLLLVGFFTGLASLLVPALVNELAVLQQIDFSASYASFLSELDAAQKWLARYNFELSNVEVGIKNGIQNLLSIESAEATVSALLGGLGNLAIAMFSVLFILFFFLRERNLMEYIFTNLLSDTMAGHMRNILPKVKTTLFRYAIGLSLQMMGIFILVYFGLRMVGVESAMVIAIFAAFINIIPYIGPMIGTVFGLLLALGQAYALDPSLPLALYSAKVLLVFAITQLTDNFIYQPVIFSNSINAHPLEIFIVISIAGLMGGILGMVIAVPGYSMLRIVAKEYLTNSKFIQAITKNV